MEIRHVMDGQAQIDRLLAEIVARAWYVRGERPMVFMLTTAGSLFGGYEGLADEVVEIQGDWRGAGTQEILNAIANFIGGVVFIREIQPGDVHAIEACMT